MTPPPTAPSRADGSTLFISRANAFIAWFATLYTELTALVAALNNLSTTDTSSSSNTIGIASGKTFTVTAGKSWQLGMQVLIASTASPTNWMFGDVTSYSGTTLVVNATAIQGSGTLSAWTISLSGPNGSAGSAALTTTNNTYTKAQRGAYSVLTDGATITPDFSLANNFRVALGGNRTLANPTNLVAGQSGVIDIHQDSTGSRTLAYAWGWQFASGTAPTLTTALRGKDKLAYSVDQYATSTITVTIAAPGVVGWTAHGLLAGQQVQLTTSGALPTGLTASTTYYVVPVDANSFQLSATQNGSAITTTGSQSGTHTMTAISITGSMILAVK